MFTGRMFLLISQYLSPPPGVPATTDWGNPALVRDRLGDAVRDLTFLREIMASPALSPAHYRTAFERTAAPVIKLVEMLKDDAPKLTAFRAELEALIAPYLKNNVLRQDFLMSRAIKC